MPRRIYTYPARAWAGAPLNLVITRRLLPVRRSACCCSSSTSCVSLRRGRVAGPEPVGRADAGMVDALAAAALQLRRHPDASPAAIRCGRTAWTTRRSARSLRRGPAARPRPRDARHHRPRRRAGRDPADAGRLAGAPAAGAGAWPALFAALLLHCVVGRPAAGAVLVAARDAGLAVARARAGADPRRSAMADARMALHAAAAGRQRAAATPAAGGACGA